MNMCQSHWDTLRAAITERGLSALVADSGEQAAANTVRELTEGRSLDSYDPLMGAFWAISSNSMQFIADIGGNPLASMYADGPEYTRCSICYLNWIMDQHDLHCTEPDCQKPKGEAAHYDWMIARAADEQVEVWKEMNA